MNSALCAAMDRRRRQLRETADERLDRLIAMERNSRISSPVPEVRRLMVEEGRAAASSPGPRRDGRGEGEAAGSTGLLPVGSGTPVPDGLLAPLFQDLGQEEAPRVFHRRLDEDDETSPAVVAELSSAVGAGQLSAQDLRGDAGQGRGQEYRDGPALLEAADGLFDHDRNSAGALMVQPGINAFWSSEVRRAAALEGVPDVARPQALPPLAGPPVSYGPVQARGEGGGGSGHPHPGGAAGDIGREQPSLRCAAGSIGPEQALLRGASGGIGPERVDCVAQLVAWVRSRPWFARLWLMVQALCRPLQAGLQLVASALGRPLVQKDNKQALCRPMERYLMVVLVLFKLVSVELFHNRRLRSRWKHFG